MPKLGQHSSCQLCRQLGMVRYGKGLDNEKWQSVVSLMGLVMDLGLRRNDQGFSGRVWSAFSVSFLAGILVIYAEQ